MFPAAMPETTSILFTYKNLQRDLLPVISIENAPCLSKELSSPCPATAAVEAGDDTDGERAKNMLNFRKRYPT
jgi:hypothetical protein